MLCTYRVLRSISQIFRQLVGSPILPADLTLKNYIHLANKVCLRHPTEFFFVFQCLERQPEGRRVLPDRLRYSGGSAHVSSSLHDMSGSSHQLLATKGGSDFQKYESYYWLWFSPVQTALFFASTWLKLS